MAEMKISSIERMTASVKSVKPEASGSGVQDVSFGKWLNQSIQNVSQMQKTADASALKLATGENKDIHGTMIQMQKAEVATNLMVAVRNKVIAAYDEIKRMQF